MEFLTEAGGFGSAVAGAGVLAGFLRPLLEWRAESDREARCLVGGLLAGLLAVLFHAAADFPMAVPATAFLVVGIAAALHGFYVPTGLSGSASGERPLREHISKWILVSVSFLCLAGAARSLPAALAGFPFAQARSAGSHEERARSLERAHRLDSRNPVYAQLLSAAYLWTADDSPSRKMEFAQKAEETALKALVSTPDHAGLLYVAGASAARLGMSADARELISLSRRLEPWRMKK